MKENPLNIYYLFVLLIFITLSAQAQEERKVAVFDPAGSVEKALLEIVREESSVVVNTTGYSVLERQLINKVLEENRFQESGLVNDEQVSDIGKRMGADYVFVTTISMLGANYYISCKMIEVATARIDKQFTGTTTNGMNDIPQTTQYIVRRLFGENVQQPFANRQRQQTNQTAQTDLPQRIATSANRQSTIPDVSYYGLLTTNGKIVFSSGETLYHDQIRYLMSNTDALAYYNKGIKQNKSGKTLIIIAYSLLGGWTIFGVAAAREPEAIGVGASLGVASFCVFGIPGYIVKSAGKKNVRKAVDVYNRCMYSYSEPPSLFEVDFGITASGGVGFVIRF